MKTFLAIVGGVTLAATVLSLVAAVVLRKEMAEVNEKVLADLP